MFIVCITKWKRTAEHDHIRIWYLPRNISSGLFMQMQYSDRQYTWKYMKWTYKSDSDWVRTRIVHNMRV